MLTTISFCGFYDSIHSSNIDYAIEQMFSDRDTGCQRNEGLEMALFNKCHYSAVYKAYAKEYVENFAREFEIPSLIFDELNSPKFYNFTTDRIFATVTLEDLLKIKNTVPLEEFKDMAKLMFTSRDGFSSFYDPDIDSWDDIEHWDANQCGCLIAAYADYERGGFDQYAENDLMEDSRGNGLYEQWIDSATPGIDRLYKIHDYLEVRAAR